MIKQIVFAVCVILLILCAMQVFGYLGDGLTTITTQVTDMTSQFGDMINQIQGFSLGSSTNDPTKTLEDIQALGGNGSALGNFVNNLFGTK
ncbi:MAG: hypothetical protein Q4Q53_03365 [Methanocorpusculum sp.]|nr:hypothetical protein [Methanocorpusculum sp.]